MVSPIVLNILHSSENPCSTTQTFARVMLVTLPFCEQDSFPFILLSAPKAIDCCPAHTMPVTCCSFSLFSMWVETTNLKRKT